MRKKFLTLLLAVTLAATSTVPVMSNPVSAVAATKKTTKKTTKKLAAKQKKLKADKAAADKVAKLIDKIYVQDNEKAKVTDSDLKKAKLE